MANIHPNDIRSLFYSQKENNNLNILMEYCAGGDLFQYIEKFRKKKIKLKEKTIWQIFIQMILGLNSIHKKKILHRDLKSQNIFLTKDLNIKIGDLGVAKKLIKTNFAKTFIGTPYYLSPEICMEKPYNDKSDVWAIGCILYELCCFSYPFDAKSQGALLLKILNNEPEKIDSNFYSKDLQNMINLLLNKNYELRPGCGDILKMKIILEKMKKNNLLNDIVNNNSESFGNINSININNNFGTNKKINVKGNKKEKEKENSNYLIHSKNKSDKNYFYFDCNEEKPQKSNNNKIIKEALTKIIKKQNNKKENILLLLDDALKGVDNKKKEEKKNTEINKNKSKEKIKEINSALNIDKIISIDDDLIKNNKDKIKSNNIQEFANSLNTYVNNYKNKTSELKERNKKIIKNNDININKTEKKEKNLEININKNDKRNFKNNNINININNDLVDNNKILNSIMNFNIINNNDSDIHININNSSNILNKNKSTISLDTSDNKGLYSEEENSEDQIEIVKEIKENNLIEKNDIKEINKKIVILKEKISMIKDDILSLIGGTDYNYIINLYNSINGNENEDKIYEKIEDFVNKYYDQEKKENFNNLYYLLISFDCKLAQKQKQKEINNI